MPETAASPSGAIALLKNRTFDEIAIGDTASAARTLSAEDIRVIAVVTGFAGSDPADAGGAAVRHLEGMIAHGTWGSALIAMVLGTRLPGPGATYLAESLAFRAPIRPGDTITTRVEIVERDPATRRVRADCRCTNQEGEVVLEGTVDLLAPAERVTWSRAALPEVKLTVAHDGTARLLEHVRALDAVRAAVVHPCDRVSLTAALDARQAGLIHPVLVAPRARLEAVAAEAGLDLGGIPIEDAVHSHAAAARAAELAAAGDVEVLIKGSLHTDELMGAVIAASAGLRTKRRVTHCFVMQTPAYPRPFIITDAAVNIAPTLNETGRPTSSWCPTSRAATCWPSSSSISAAPTLPA